MTATIELQEFKDSQKWLKNNPDMRISAELSRDRSVLRLVRATPDYVTPDGWTEAEAPTNLWQRSIRVREDVGEPSVISLAWVK